MLRVDAAGRTRSTTTAGWSTASRARLPHASIGSDMIVGFPGETDEDFAANLDYLPSSPLTHLHVFPYSDRPGHRGVGDARQGARRRHPRARRASCARSARQLRRALPRAQLGTVRPGLTLEDGTLVVTDNYLKVRIPPGLPRNERVVVRIGQR